MNATKIVATMGPATADPRIVERLIGAGMDVARLNFSHGDLESHGRHIDRVRAASSACGRPVAILADLPGPKLRVGSFAEESIRLESGERFTLTTEELEGDGSRVFVDLPELPERISRGDRVFLNDGYIQLEVEKAREREVICTVLAGGELRSRQGLNIPGIDLGIDAFTSRDRECLRFALERGVDAVAPSFVEDAEDVEAVRLAARACGRDPFVIAKIERARALDRIDEIVNAADGIMIARGDLGVEVPVERVAVVQKDLIGRANLRAKPVITATQMLESMIRAPMPTRAEVSDVSNAILDGTDAVMLSGESAVGNHPVEAVEMLARIAAAVEPTRRRLPVSERLGRLEPSEGARPEDLIALSLEASLEHLRPAAVFVPSETGRTARRLAALHLPVPVVAISASASTCRSLLVSYGVVPVHEPEMPSSWNQWIRSWLERHRCDGRFAILTQRSSGSDAPGNHRIEIVPL